MKHYSRFRVGLAIATGIVVAGAAAMPVQASPVADGSVNPNGSDRQQEILREMRQLEDKRRADLEHQGLIDKFMAAVKLRKWHYKDFDQVVTQGQTPMSTQVLELISQSYYAADIAYYLGKHPDQAMTISRVPKPAAIEAVKTIESTLIARGV